MCSAYNCFLSVFLLLINFIAMSVYSVFFHPKHLVSEVGVQSQHSRMSVTCSRINVSMMLTVFYIFYNSLINYLVIISIVVDH